LRRGGTVERRIERGIAEYKNHTTFAKEFTVCLGGQDDQRVAAVYDEVRGPGSVYAPREYAQGIGADKLFKFGVKS
jgi:hypothetical protein